MTFAITGFCERTGMVGTAVSTSSICVGSRCPHVRAGVGAVSSQNVTLPSLGITALDSMHNGKSAGEALEETKAKASFLDYRQLLLIDNKGNTAHFAGRNILGTNAFVESRHCVAAGNLLSTEAVPTAIADAFVNNADRHLAERLMLSLEAGRDSGGEMGPTHSAALLIAHEQPWPLVDLRVDWHDSDPITALRSLWMAYEPEMNDYLARALYPDSAPSYGVPGDA